MRWVIAGTHCLDSRLYRVMEYHLARYLTGERHYEILFLAAPISPLHFLLQARNPHFCERRAAWGKAPRPLWPGAWQYAPLSWLPALRGTPLDRAGVLRRSLDATTPSLRAVLKETGFLAPDLLFVTNLQYAWLDRLMAPGQLVYHCKDDIAAFPQAPRCLLEAESALLGRCDRSFATARHLCRLLETRGARVPPTLLRAGVDASLFEGDFEPPPALHRLPRPRALFLGALNERLDLELLDTLTERMPGLQFVLAGPVSIEPGPLGGRANVHLPGPVPPDAIPAWYAQADVALLPFRRSPLVAGTSPIKVFEYLAAGLPVVATRWDELESIGAPVEMAEGAEAFEQALRRVLVEQDPAAREARRAFARENAWAQRFRELERQLA